VRECEPENKRERKRAKQNTKEAKIEKMKGFYLSNENCFTINKKFDAKNFVLRDAKIDKDQTIFDYQQRFSQQK
jgi:hypothetical protein